ncbi:Hypothetical protein ORPV_319 [Orpheovirus IHUMI-LCC2]|uniref:Uncharacterized protein n=1 Tax=Orpheovirus IHUMI-LCC2 TaxID=2023057 RepID=A0A2I2L3X1_9VIRU|nr:Hypothetical protein ORPV_319 [Orpheovirus IHUMI-LCC2]SNW62223.1 Hypothetical protein ORPV_319 [Orpheovirus IHUMI-LCC2]
MEKVYYGETQCQMKKLNGHNCTNLAYYIYNNMYLCGVHCKANNRTNILPQRKSKEELQEKIHQEQNLLTTKLNIIEMHKNDNISNGRSGNVILSKMYMMKTPTSTPGYINVYPNYKDGGRKDGLGMPSLSPKSIGPINHGQPGLPPSLNLENFHQGSKCFIQETTMVGDKYYPSQVYRDNREKFYKDSQPHRHKFKGNIKGNVNIPVFFVWVDKDGKEHYLDYITSRQFYCNFYERSVINDPNYTNLLSLIKTGYNLQICGYDAHNIDEVKGISKNMSLHEKIERTYLSPDKPFGHELVLFSMLMLKEDNYPWRKYKSFDF